MFKQNLRQKQEDILGVFSRTLEKINAVGEKIRQRREKNSLKVQELERENDELYALYSENLAVQENISKLLGK